LECESDAGSDSAPEQDSEHEENSVASAGHNCEQSPSPAHAAYLDGVAKRARLVFTSEPRVELCHPESGFAFGQVSQKTADEWECVDVLEEAPFREIAIPDEEGNFFDGEKQDCDADCNNGAADEDFSAGSRLQSGYVASGAKRRLELVPSELDCAGDGSAASRRLQAVFCETASRVSRSDVASSTDC
jgi:hypothetical protein